MSEAHEDGTPRSIRLGFTLLGCSLGGVAVLIATTFLPPVRDWLAGDTTLTVEARTESVVWRINASPDVPYVLPLPPGSFIQQTIDDNLNMVTTAFPASFPAVKTASEIEFSLTSRGSCELGVSFLGVNETTPKIAIYDGTKNLQLDKVATFVIRPLTEGATNATGTECSAKQPVDILLENASGLRLGEAVSARALTDDYAPSPVVKSGKAVAYNRAAFYGNRFNIGENEFNRGDQIELVPPSGTRIRGVITFDPNPGPLEDATISVVAHANNATVKIERFGGGYEFKATTWLAIASQPIVQFFFSTLIAVLAMISFVMGVKKWRNPPKAATSSHEALEEVAERPAPSLVLSPPPPAPTLEKSSPPFSA